MIWTCNGGDAQRFVLNSNGSIIVATNPEQVLDGDGTNAGDNVGTWSYSGGTDQLWSREH